jgi:hypothetical protein
VGEWQGDATPTQLDNLVKLAAATAVTRAPLSVVEVDMLAVSAAAAVSGITEKTIRKALKDGCLPFTVDTLPGPWPKQTEQVLDPACGRRCVQNERLRSVLQKEGGSRVRASK